MVGLRIENRGAFLRLAADAAALDEGIKGAVRDVAREYNAKVRAELSRPKSGRLYGVTKGRIGYRIVRKRVELFGGAKRTVTRKVALKRSGAPRVWRASRPGEAPAVFTGNLLRGLRIKFPTREKGYGARVFTSRGLAAHRHLLEFGTGERVQRTWRGKAVNRRVGRIQPRPIWTPMQARAEEDLEKRVLRAIDATDAFRGG